MGALSFYYFYLEGSRHVYKNNYMERSLLLKSFMDGLREYSLTLPPYKAIRLVDLGTYKESEARDSHHFIPSGLDTLAPERVFQIAATVLNSGEGTQMRDPKSPLWIHAYPNISEPIFIRYTAKGFQHE